MLTRSRIVAGALLGLLTVLSPGAARTKAAQGRPAAKPAKAVAPAGAIPRVSEKNVAKVLAKYKNKVVVANFWATWCGPCREEFPDLVKLYHKYRDQGLVVLGFSMDDTDSIDQVRKFIRDTQADFPHYLVDAQDLENFINAVDQDWPGAIPTTFIYDRKGKLAKRLIGSQELGDFEREVKPFLGR